MFLRLAGCFQEAFKAHARIGARNWDGEADDDEDYVVSSGRKKRQAMETAAGVLWTVSSLNGCTIVKFGANEVEGGKAWLRLMLEGEGSVVRYFGERALLCLK